MNYYVSSLLVFTMVIFITLIFYYMFDIKPRREQEEKRSKQRK